MDITTLAAALALSGKGSSLPEVTSDDNGDVLTVVSGEWAKAEVPTELPTASASNLGETLTVVKSYTKGAVIVPEQTVTIEDMEAGAELTPSSNWATLFVEDATVIGVIDGTEYMGVVMQGDGNLYVPLNDDTFEFYNDPDTDKYMLWANETDTYTVSLYVAQATYGWDAVEYPNYDVVFKIDFSDSTGEVAKGDYADIRTKLESDTPVMFGVFSYGKNSGKNPAVVDGWELDTGSILVSIGNGFSGWEWSSDGSFVCID